MRKWVATVVGLALATAACSGSGEGSAATSFPPEPVLTTIPAPTTSAVTTSAVTTSAAPVTTAAPTTSALPAGDTLVPPENFGDDYRFIWDEIQRTIDWLAVNPDPNLVSLVIDPQCPCFAEWVEHFTELRDNGWLYTGEHPAETLEFRVEVVIDEDTVGAIVRQRSDADQIVDSSGTVVRRLAAWESDSAVTLARSAEGRWRIALVTSR